MNNDPINPQHYKHLPVEAIEIIEAAIEGAPSPQAAAAQSHLLGYALRANQKGQLAIDAGKAEWYAARWIKAIREAEAKAIPANETPKPSPMQPPTGYRLLGPAKDEPRIEGDSIWSHGARDLLTINVHQVEIANRDNWRACRKIEPPPKRYREPTQADLKNGPIECEVRDCDIQAWRKATLQSIYLGAAYEFQVQRHGYLHEKRYAQCRIEVTE